MLRIEIWNSKNVMKLFLTFNQVRTISRNDWLTRICCYEIRLVSTIKQNALSTLFKGQVFEGFPLEKTEKISLKENEGVNYQTTNSSRDTRVFTFIKLKNWYFRYNLHNISSRITAWVLIEWQNKFYLLNFLGD